MRVVSKIPDSLSDIFFKASDGYYYNCIGAKIKASAIFKGFLVINKGNFLNAKIVGDNLIIYKLNAEEDNGVITFSREFEHAIEYDAEYHEMSHIPEYIMNSINAAWNINTTRIYMQKIMSYQDYYDELLDLDCISYTDNNVECMVSIFSSGMNKYIPSLLENGVTDFVKKMFDGKLDLSNLEVTRINKKVIKLVKETGIPMELACQLVENHNVNAIMQFNKVLKFFKAETETCWQIIQDMGDNINLTQFGNYLIRSIFLTNNVKSTDLSGKFVSEYSILQFLHAYQDYLNLVHNDETADLFPEDVREAEKAVLDRLEYEEDMKKCEESSRIAGKFAEATKKYENLKYEDGVFTVEIPKLPHDLFKESMALHHCVKIYVQNVADGTSEICFVRKNGEPYMTVEIRNGKLIQAKKTCNLLPNEEDKDFLEKWCKEKEITIVNY